MAKLTKKQKLAAEKIEAGKLYSLQEASQLVKEITMTKFDASVDIDIRLGVDPRKANQMVRGVVSLPNGTGKVTRVLALVGSDMEAAAKEAGADYPREGAGGFDRLICVEPADDRDDLVVQNLLDDLVSHIRLLTTPPPIRRDDARRDSSSCAAFCSPQRPVPG